MGLHYVVLQPGGLGLFLVGLSLVYADDRHLNMADVVASGATGIRCYSPGGGAGAAGRFSA